MMTKNPMVSVKQIKTVVWGGWIACLSISESLKMRFSLFFAFTEVQLEQKSVPTAVFGGLKEDWKNDSLNFAKIQAYVIFQWLHILDYSECLDVSLVW